MVVLLVATSTWTAPAVALECAPATQELSGIAIVGRGALQSRPAAEVQAHAFWQAWDFAEATHEGSDTRGLTERQRRSTAGGVFAGSSASGCSENHGSASYPQGCH